MPTDAECEEDSTDYEWLDEQTFFTRRCNVFHSIALNDEQYRTGKLVARPWTDHCNTVGVESIYQQIGKYFLVGSEGTNGELEIQNWYFEGDTFTSSVIATIPREERAYNNPSKRDDVYGKIKELYFWREGSLHWVVLDRGEVRVNVNLEKLLGAEYKRRTFRESPYEFAEHLLAHPPDYVGLVDRDASTGQLRWTFLDSEPLEATVPLDLPSVAGKWYLNFPRKYLRR
jgi:hypothetical protein